MKAASRSAGAADRLAQARARIIVALDVPTAAACLRVARRLHGRAGMVKVGSRLFTAAGPDVVRQLKRRGERVFLDLKFHDIPSVVADACAEAARLGVSLLTVHAAGGPAMLRAARAALEKHSRGRQRPRLLGVMLLTSLDAAAVRRIGFPGSLEANVKRLARLALTNGCDGLIAAPTDVPGLRRAFGQKFLLVTPGIRPAGGPGASDQKRVATAGTAIRAGADYVVVGRAVLRAASPPRALDALAEEIRAARA